MRDTTAFALTGCSLLLVAAGGALLYHQLEKLIMATKQEVLDSIARTNEALTKVSEETTQLVADVASLREQLENAGVDDEILEAARALEARAQAIDDMVPDATSGDNQPI